ncbi:MAG: putative DNA binding domain-containing protein [Pyrinomonadaceae bacterium]|nr:putative DNA binding domain-containing protein [Pyrinomonadaceae bacterium]
MARRKFRNNQRNEPVTQRSFQEYILNTSAPQTSRTELLRLIRGGEDTFLELKVKLSNSERIAQGIVALANTSGGVIVFGVNDQLRVEGLDYPDSVQEELVRICREDIVPPIIPLLDCLSFDNGRRVVALEIEGKRPPYRTRDGRYFLRIGAEKREATREELSAWLEEIRPLGYENVTVLNATENDIDDALLWSFAKHFEEDFELKISYNTGEFLKKDLLLAVGNTDEFVPTNAAILLFGKNERVAKLVPRSGVTLVRYAGDTQSAQIVEKTQTEGNLLSLYESAMRFIKLYTDLRDEKTVKSNNNGNSPIQARANYRFDVISEAVANALVHRDLALREPATKIQIFDSFIEISNPRRTNGFTPPASRAIRYGITQRLNPQISAIFSSEAYEANHSKIGLPQLLRNARIFSGKRAEIYTSNDEFKLKIYGV